MFVTASLEERDNGYIAPRKEATYHCPMGHQTVAAYAIPAWESQTIPADIQCHCHQLSLLDEEFLDATHGLPEKGRGFGESKTHYEHLMERRTTEELQATLQEALDTRRNKRGC